MLEEKINSLKSFTNGQNIIIFHEAYAYVADDFSMNACYLLDLDEERSVSAGAVSYTHLQKIIDKSKMDLPEAMIETQCETMVEEFAQRIAQSGLTMEDVYKRQHIHIHNA